MIELKISDSIISNIRIGTNTPTNILHIVGDVWNNSRVLNII